MSRHPRAPKQVVAFKVDPDLAALLDAMPNKSEFIRAAVQSRLTSVCPLCRGTGVAPHGAVADDYVRLVQQHPLVACSGCGAREPRPCHSPGHCDEDARIAAFERFGIFFCEPCFAAAARCDGCTRPLVAGRGGRAHKRLCDVCRAG
jgi:hypothetical protein